eukprot:3075456-Rhodomonas_salina.1
MGCRMQGQGSRVQREGLERRHSGKALSSLQRAQKLEKTISTRPGRSGRGGGGRRGGLLCDSASVRESAKSPSAPVPCARDPARGREERMQKRVGRRDGRKEGRRARDGGREGRDRKCEERERTANNRSQRHLHTLAFARRVSRARESNALSCAAPHLVGLAREP